METLAISNGVLFKQLQWEKEKNDHLLSLIVSTTTKYKDLEIKYQHLQTEYKINTQKLAERDRSQIEQLNQTLSNVQFSYNELHITNQHLKQKISAIINDQKPIITS